MFRCLVGAQPKPALRHRMGAADMDTFTICLYLFDCI